MNELPLKSNVLKNVASANSDGKVLFEKNKYKSANITCLDKTYPLTPLFGIVHVRNAVHCPTVEGKVLREMLCE